MLGLQRVRRVGSIDNQDFPLQILDRFDFRLRHQFILRAFAAHHDNHVLVSELDHRHRVIHCEIRKVAFPSGQVCAQHVGIRQVFRFDFNAVFGKDSLLVCRDKLQRTPQQRQHFDFLQARRLRKRTTAEKRRKGNRKNYFSNLVHGAPSFSLSSDHSATGMGSRMGFPRLGQLNAYSPVSVAAQMILRSHSIRTLSTVRS